MPLRRHLFLVEQKGHWIVEKKLYRSAADEAWTGVWCWQYRALAPMYYRGAAAAIIVYDITQEVMITVWIVSIRQLNSVSWLLFNPATLC